MTVALPQLLAPELLEHARRLEARARELVRGSGHGVHRSSRLGGGSEFSEYKAYSPGDDLRSLDWKVAARRDQLLVRRFESDRRSDVHIVLDRSASMGFGTTERSDPAPWGGPWPSSKWELARLLALTLGFVFLRQGDRVGLSLVDGRGGRPSAPRAGLRQLGELAHRIVAEPPEGEGAIGRSLEELLFRSRSGIVIVLSDLLTEKPLLPALSAHVGRGREAWVFHVVDPAEIEFPYEEPTRFVDLETSEEMSLNPREFGRSYRAEFAAFLDRQERDCLDARVRYRRLRTDAPMDVALREFLVR
ncbi:MAG: DUF58 domain-containing protein [Myxococcota bacterium]|nr:DUF58 domain-containing protein [Myxococcota bacterium]